MEALVVLAVIIVLCLVLGVSVEMIMLGILALIELLIVLMALFFVYSCISLALSKSKKAVFTRIDKSPKGKFKVAYYSVDGEEYPCAFPSEMILTDKMYHTDRKITVMLNRRRGSVFDIWAILTSIIGLVCSNAAVLMTLNILNQVLE